MKKPKEGEVIRKRQRHHQYRPWMCDKIVEVASQGGHVAKMCQEIGIKSRDTFYRWLHEIPEFKEAYEESRLVSQAFYEDVALAGALGKIKGFNVTSLALILNNKFKDEYTRNTSGSNTEINIGSINSIDNLNSDELDAKIEKLQRKLNLIPTEVTNGSKDPQEGAGESLGGEG